ncbi:MAG TPA: hypothetical protein VHJ69_10615, partial [Gemmatimonadales bacterium]|nr:hypothetical protein [Gemmatimonadales bacterium]
MFRPIVAGAIAAALLGSAASRSAAHQSSYPACALVSAAEIAKFLSVPAVQLDSVNSGRNDFSGVELCSWYVALRDPRGVSVKLRLAKSADETAALVVGARIDDEFDRDKAENIAGLGDEAQWAERRHGHRYDLEGGGRR